MQVFIDCRPYSLSRKPLDTLYVIYAAPDIDVYNNPLEAMSRPILFLSQQEITVVVPLGKTVIFYLRQKYPLKKFIEIEEHLAPTVQYPLNIRYVVSPILPGLYLSGAEAASDICIHCRYNIKYILNATEEIPNAFGADSSYQYKKLYIMDLPDTNIAEHFVSSIKFIQEGLSSGKPVLVHCAAGISRSSTIIIAYIMWKQNCTFEEAYSYVLSKRSVIEPNLGFYRQLKNFEQTLNLSKPMDL